MEIRSDEDGWVFDEIDPIFASLLQLIAESARSDDPAVSRRIFSTPTAGGDAAADADWREYVEPGMRELFKSHTDTVAADLAAMKMDASTGANDGTTGTHDGATGTLRIPAGHARAWIHTLNQAAQALGIRHGVTEEDINGRRQHTGEKGFVMMQIEFYLDLLGLLLRRTEL